MSKTRVERQAATTTIAICNQKGGVAKTTTRLSFGACLAELGHPVLAQPITLYAPRTRRARQYRALAKELLNHD